jgi:ribosomal protein RSM22 (predicted rRNA methylase)
MPINKLAQIIHRSMSKHQSDMLVQASARLSERYQKASYNNNLNLLEKYAYVLARMPATFAALSNVINILNTNLKLEPTSLLDIGAGPATASWAALSCFQSLSKLIIIEHDPEWLSLAQKLAHENSRFKNATWLKHDLVQPLKNLDQADLVIAAYAFQELDLQRQISLVQELFAKTKQALIIIEPGTPRGFSYIKNLREVLIKHGAHIIAPCTHQQSCPVSNNDWCHFSARLSRHEFHRRAKSATLGYEDEKFSYLIASPLNASTQHRSRIVRAPIKRAGHIILDTCEESKLTRKIFTRSDKERYREIKKLSWGDSL